MFTLLKKRPARSARRRQPRYSATSAQVLEQRSLLTTFDSLPPEFEQLRAELGAEAFNEYLESNNTQFGNRQGIDQAEIDAMSETQREQFDDVEKALEKWQREFNRPTSDFNDDGTLNPLTDGILSIRYMAGFRGDALIDGIADPAEANDIETYFQQIMPDLDIDGDGEVQALTDGIMLTRRMAGFEGQAVTNNAINRDGVRGNAYQVASYMQANLLNQRPVVLTDFINDHLSDETKDKIKTAEENAESAQDAVEEAEGDLELLEQIRDRAQEKLDAANERLENLRAELDEINGQIQRYEDALDYMGGGYAYNEQNELLLQIAGNDAEVIGEVRPLERGGWTFVEPDGTAHIFETEEQARDFGKQLAQDELDKRQADKEEAEQELPGLRANKQTVEQEIQQAETDRDNAVECAQEEIMNGKSDADKNRIDGLLGDADSPEDIDQKINNQKDEIDDRKEAATTAEQEAEDCRRDAVKEAVEGLAQEVADKEAALKAKRQKVAEDTIWLELGASILKQLGRQVDFDAAAFADAVGELGDSVGDLPVEGSDAASLGIQAGGAALAGIIKIQSWITQQVLAGTATDLMNWINGSSEIRNYLEERGIEGGTISLEQAERIKHFIDTMLHANKPPQEFLDSWEECLKTAANELAELKTKLEEGTSYADEHEIEYDIAAGV